MPEGNLPRPKVPTTPQDLSGPGQAWQEYFGDAAEQQYMLSDIRERHLAVVLQDGQDFFWMKRKQSGTRCPFLDDQARQCRDPLNAESPCYNTGFVGGYEPPMLIKVALPTTSQQQVRQEEGLLKIEQMRPWTIWTPELTDKDLLVKSLTGERYEVLGVTPTGPWRGLWVAQFFDARALQVGADFGFNVPVPGTGR